MHKAPRGVAGVVSQLLSADKRSVQRLQPGERLGADLVKVDQRAVYPKVVEQLFQLPETREVAAELV